MWVNHSFGFVCKYCGRLYYLIVYVARVTSLQEEIKGLKNNLERVEEERKQAQDMLNHSEKVRSLKQ